VVRHSRHRDPHDPPEKPENPENCVGIDVGILKYTHDTDGTPVESLELSDERERLERAQRDLSRKQHGSDNWKKQRRVVAERHAELKNKRRDFLHKLSNYCAREYDFVAVRTWTRRGWSNYRATRGTGQVRRGGRSCGCSNTSANAKERTSSL
jgi:putative transposase